MDVPRESLLEETILEMTVMLCLWVGYKGKNDGLDSTGLVGGEERAKGGRDYESEIVVVRNNGFWQWRRL